MSKAKRNSITPTVEIGKRFHRLLVIGQAKPIIEAHGGRRKAVLCICDCGNKKIIRAYCLAKGQSQSCGCLIGEATTIAKTIHGDHGTVEYETWKRMTQRCYNSNNPRYSYWGGRGIRVCNRWRESYAAFLKDMGRRPSKDHSIDRYPDNDGDYKPNNCRWATRSQQRRNRRDYLARRNCLR